LNTVVILLYKTPHLGQFKDLLLTYVIGYVRVRVRDAKEKAVVGYASLAHSRIACARPRVGIVPTWPWPSLTAHCATCQHGAMSAPPNPARSQHIYRRAINATLTGLGSLCFRPEGASIMRFASIHYEAWIWLRFAYILSSTRFASHCGKFFKS